MRRCNRRKTAKKPRLLKQRRKLKPRQRKQKLKNLLIRKLLLKALKNLLAYVLVAIGIVLLVLPGQGVLTIVVGLMLADFPGKHRLIRALLTRGPVLAGINWLRARAHRPPLLTRRVRYIP